MLEKLIAIHPSEGKSSFSTVFAVDRYSLHCSTELNRDRSDKQQLFLHDRPTAARTTAYETRLGHLRNRADSKLLISSDITGQHSLHNAEMKFKL